MFDLTNSLLKSVPIPGDYVNSDSLTLVTKVCDKTLLSFYI